MSSKDQAIHQQQAKARKALEKNEAKGGADNYSDRLGRRERPNLRGSLAILNYALVSRTLRSLKSKMAERVISPIIAIVTFS